MTQIDKSRFEWIGSDSARREGISRPSTTFWKDAIGRLMKNKVAVVCFFIIVLLILSCIIVPFFSPFESREQHLGEVNKGFMTVCTDSRYEDSTMYTISAPITSVVTFFCAPLKAAASL